MSKTLDNFIRQHKHKDDETITHTRIGNKNLHVHGGSFHIPPDELSVFYKLYNKKVFTNKEYEYLVERQIKTSGPILVDLDFRYSSDIEERQHTSEHIYNIIQLYLRKLEELLEIKDCTEFPVFIFEKPDVNTLDSITKDGIHIIFGLHLDNTGQLMLRSRVLEDMEDILSGLNLENDMESVVDICLPKGSNGFTMYGSRKPGDAAYELKYCYNVEYEGGQWSDLDEVNIESVEPLDLLQMISSAKTDNMSYPLKPLYSEEYEQKKKQKSNHIIRSGARAKAYNHFMNFSEITDQKALEEEVENLLESTNSHDYHLRETYEFTMILPAAYYTDYDKWLTVGFALHNTDPRLFLVWMLFSSQSNKFYFSEINNNFMTWKNMRNEGVTERSILYWAREGNPVEYEKIRVKTIDYFIEKTLDAATDHNMALVLYHKFKGHFICASIKHKIWYEFHNHKWRKIDSGTTLRSHITKTGGDDYTAKVRYLQNLITDGNPNNEALQNKISKLMSIIIKMGNVDGKNRIMREAQELFYDREFFEKLDDDPYLLHFNNGIFDFNMGELRNGRPEDYISLTTKQDYVKYDPKDKDHVKYKKEITDFFGQLFTNKKLNRYMWEHLASTLIGTNENETFNIYNGVGRNGKSKLVDLMSKVLGELKGVLPVSLCTRKRGESGKASPELARLRGVRYAVMQEPSKNDKINEGLMKELTGGDTIQARALFNDPVEYKPQFKMVVCTNNLFDIESNDDGTWRRIRVCEFLSKFCKDPSKKKTDKEFQGISPSVLLAKFDLWVPIFTWMLIEVVKKTKGVVKDCNMVLSASKKYRGSQDYLGNFFDEAIEPTDNYTLKIAETYNCFKDWYVNMGYGRKVPRRCELQGLLEKKLGIYPKTGWFGYHLKEPETVS
jgi:P4 family phage/plasmid primase-like protien